jgi:hypothetical protein
MGKCPHMTTDLYLIYPPKDALHKPVSASKIVFAGDSAGGGLCLNVLCIIRDMGLPMPAGAVLISPWVDLNHSFPSVMDNVNTDIIPPHGFMAKPSTLWPVEQPDHTRVQPTTTNAPPQPGHPDTQVPDEQRLANQKLARHLDQEEDAVPSQSVQTQEQMQETAQEREEQQVYRPEPDYSSTNQASEDASRPAPSSDRPIQILPRTSSTPPTQSSKTPVGPTLEDLSAWEPKPPKVLMDDPQAVPLELRAQIQLYATNE